MKDERIKECTQFLRENCDEFIARVWLYMIDNNWKWSICGPMNEIPSQKKIKEIFFGLLDNLEDEKIKNIESGGFTIHINEEGECVEAYFGPYSNQKEGITLISKRYIDNTNITSFIDFLRDEYPFIIKKYNEWKSEKGVKTDII